MRKLYLLIPALILLSFYSCKKNSSAPQVNNAALIVGKWSLQRQQVTDMINGVTQIDTMFVASALDSAYAQFNADATFASAGFAEYEGTTANSLASPIVQEDTTSGIYSLTPGSFTMNASPAGFYFGPLYASNCTPPVITVLSKTEQLIQLTATSLIIKLSLNENVTTGATTQAIQSTQEFYYVK